jgi:hypothetical protein
VRAAGDGGDQLGAVGSVAEHVRTVASRCLRRLDLQVHRRRLVGIQLAGRQLTNERRGAEQEVPL